MLIEKFSMVKWVDFPISKNDTTILKGVSIMAIVLHNWCHMLPVSAFYFRKEVSVLWKTDSFYDLYDRKIPQQVYRRTS